MNDVDEAADFAHVAERGSEAADTQVQRNGPKLTSEPVATPRWRLALVVVSSAFLSGIAVVLWNRHSLARMRQAAQAATGNENSEVPAEFI